MTIDTTQLAVFIEWLKSQDVTVENDREEFDLEWAGFHLNFTVTYQQEIEESPGDYWTAPCGNVVCAEVEIVEYLLSFDGETIELTHDQNEFLLNQLYKSLYYQS